VSKDSESAAHNAALDAAISMVRKERDFRRARGKVAVSKVERHDCETMAIQCMHIESALASIKRPENPHAHQD